MAGLWTGSAINSTETAMVFNQLWNRGKIMEIVRKKNGALYAIWGKPEMGSTPAGPNQTFERIEKVTGHNIEVTDLGKLKTISTVADGSAEMATATLTNSQDYWGGQEFALAHFADAHGLPRSEIDRYAGDELKTSKYIDKVMRMLALSLENTWGTAIHATGASKQPSRTVLGSLQGAVSDGTTATETQSDYSTYGTIDRTDSGNADFRSTVTVCGNLDLNKIQTMQNTLIAAGGDPSLGVAPVTPYTKIQQLVQGYTEVTYDETWAKFGQKFVMFSGIRFVLDQRCLSTDMFLLSPDDFTWYQKDINFTESGIVVDISRVASYVLNWGAWCQLICRAPSHQGKFVAITG